MTAVHPHGRGDNSLGVLLLLSETRFTPTGVGTTQPTISVLGCLAVHPHGRGDNEPVPVVQV